jgi:hypothetical protein
VNQLPDPQQPTAEAAGQPALDAQARAFLAAVEDAMRTPTSYRDETPVPPIGSALPVPQPGRPAMSQGATDASVMMIAGAGSVSMVSVSAGVLMYLSQYADPVVCGIVLGAPTAVVLALCRLVRRTKETVQAAPAEHHHHYNGPVTNDQRRYEIETRGVWANTRNELPK